MKIIGVTGGIGSGKSTVSRILRDLGAVIVDADYVARTVTSKGSKALEELTAYFGPEILDTNGELNRRKLAELAFRDPVKKHALDTITHKFISDRLHETIQNIKTSGKHEVAVIDAPIPVERGFLDLADEVWTVTAERETRIRRVMERSSFSYEEAVQRVQSQMRDDEYLRIADEVIDNSGSIEELEQAVVRLFLQSRQDRRK